MYCRAKPIGSIRLLYKQADTLPFNDFNTFELFFVTLIHHLTFLYKIQSKQAGFDINF